MKARVWGSAFVLAAVCAVSSGCYTGLNGAAVAGGSPPPTSRAHTTTTTRFGGPGNLVPNGSFEAGTSPWQPMPYSQVIVTQKPHRVGTQALLALPASAGVPSFGAQIRILDNPVYRTSYEARMWVRGNRLAGIKLHLVLWILKPGVTGWVTVDSLTRPLTARWQRVSVRGKVRSRRATVLGLGIWATGAVKRWSRLVIDGVEVNSVSAGAGHG